MSCAKPVFTGFVAAFVTGVATSASACAVAAALSGRAGSGKVVAIVSGGNIDLEKFTHLVSPAA